MGRSWFRATALWAAAGTATLGWLLVSVLGGVQEAVPAYGRGRADSVLEVAGLEPAWLVGLASASLVVVVGVAWTVSSFVRAHAVAVAAVSALLVGVGAYLIAALSGAPLWFLVTGSFLGAMGFFVAPAWIRTPARDRGLLLAMAGGTALLAAWDATGSHALGSALAGTAALLAAALVGIGVRRSVSLAPASWSPTRLIPGPTVQIAAGVLVIAVAAAWFEFAAATAMSSFVVAVVLAAWAAAAGLVAQWASHRPAGSVRGWAESASVLVGLAALGLVSGPSQAGVVLTLLGAAAAGVVLISADRLWCSWLAAVLLAAATLCRLVAGDPFPEAYALPVAALLVAGGWWRLRLEPAMSSFTALGAGLGLGFGPSLLLAWGDPLSGRALAVFVAALAVLAFGVWSRWAAPLWAGALAAGSLAVVNLFPTIYVLPRWVVLGAVGTILVGVGVTWEARLREARRAGHYLGLLR